MSARPAWIQSIHEVAAGIDRGARIPYRVVFSHGTLEAGVYMPGERDPQQPHTRDEAYIVMAGTGVFVSGGERAPFGPGDFIFVGAGVEHRFEEYTPDLAVWVMFYGPEGGEKP
ncbi:MAG TPA: cupin domain-containing protein [Tepidiformaceae bacterium]|nr:cupin domain-containing protein [Tepidiformaceae bacterium]